MLRAFFDEASDNTNDFLMAGWLADFEEWEKFSDAWGTELKFSPSINYFNHNEAQGRKDEFEGWSESARDDKMMALAGVIARHNLTGMVGEIKIPQLTSLFAHSIVPKRTLRSIVKFTEPYHHACQCVVAVTLGHQVERAKNLTDRVDFIFDEGVPFLDDIVANYPRLKEVLPPKAVAIAGTIIRGNDKHITALQAADFLAGQELLQLRIGTKPKPLSVMDNGRINKFSCHGEALKTIPQSVSKLNVIWATKQLDKIQERKKKKDAWENKEKK
ncbi:MAG: hypothetical protein WBF01_15260 [Candidatus Acidiferrum sp.]